MGQTLTKKTWAVLRAISLSLLFPPSLLFPSAPLLAAPPRPIDKTVECEILIVGAGLAGSAAAYEGLLAGKSVCLTDITDWVGGQISSQGTSALDERPTQAQKLFYPRGYLYTNLVKMNVGSEIANIYMCVCVCVCVCVCEHMCELSLRTMQMLCNT